MTINIPDRLCSRKLWITVIAYAIMLAPKIGIDITETVQYIMASTGPAYIMAQGLVDMMSAKQPNVVMLPTPPSDHISL